MDHQPVVVTPENYARALNVVGTKVTVLVSRKVTQGFEITLQEGEEGSGPPPHSHKWDEAFFVLRGSVEFICAGDVVMAGVGTLVHVPGGTVHSFRYGNDGGQILEIAGHGASATDLFATIDRDLPAGPPDIGKILEIFQKNGVTPGF